MAEPQTHIPTWGQWLSQNPTHEVPSPTLGLTPLVLAQTTDCVFLPVPGRGGGRRDGPPGLGLEGLLQQNPEHGEHG